MSSIPGIRDYFDGKSVFITGGTGFVGKVLVEKLLRSCAGIDKIYLLIRSKKGVPSNRRLQELLNSKIFSLELNIKELEHKVIAVDGDLTKEGLGLDESHRKLMEDSLSVVFHVAGDVRFDETVREAVSQNVIGTKHVLDFAKECLSLEAFVHVSTAYTYCHKFDCEERLYPTMVTPGQMIDACATMSDQELESFTKPLLEGRPNNYTFVKALAEHLVNEQRPNNVAVAIVRPSIVFPSYEEPVPGWIDTFQGTSFVVTFGALGVMRSMDMDGSVKPCLIPVDMFCNGLIASAWHLATYRPKEVMIYNMTTEPHNSLAYHAIIEIIRAEQFKSPSIRAIRPYVASPAGRPSRLNLAVTVLFSHFLFAYFVDLLAFVSMSKPKIVKLTSKMHYGCGHFSHFMLHQWHFRTQNSRNLMEIVKSSNSKLDWDTFKFDPDTIDYEHLGRHFWIGLRRYLLNEQDDTIDAAKLRLIKITYLYRMFLVVWYTLLIFLVYATLSWPTSYLNSK